MLAKPLFLAVLDCLERNGKARQSVGLTLFGRSGRAQSVVSGFCHNVAFYGAPQALPLNTEPIGAKHFVTRHDLTERDVALHVYMVLRKLGRAVFHMNKLIIQGVPVSSTGELNELN